MRGCSAAIFASGLMDRLKESTIQIFMALLSKVTTEYDENVPDIEERLTFVQSGYMMERYIPT